MLGITLKLDNTDQYLDLEITPSLVQKKIETKSLLALIYKSDFKHFFIFDESVLDALSSYYSAVKNNHTDVIRKRIGERQDSQIKCRVVEDYLSAYLTITTGYAGKLPSVGSLLEELHLAGVKRGISKKRLVKLVRQCTEALPGDVFQELVAKGLPPRIGKPSTLKPLVQNALERILKPQSVGTARVDMRNLGAVICVQKGNELLRRLPPTEGRKGFTVGGEIIKSIPGEWVKFRPGEGTVVSSSDENLLLADIAGMPKFRGNRMWVDDIFICKGVNVGSGNVSYDGSVLINGDVTEKMEIHATGDVTVNGFVESATISAGGDIIITEGAMGKVNESATQYSTKLTSKGNVHVQHGQGLDINCNGNVTVGRQLAYSRINCRGKVSVGVIDKPNGNIFSCTVKCQDSITAGTFGAVSGSNLNVDFSEGFNSLLERKDTLEEMLKKIKENNLRHSLRMKVINAKFIPEDMKKRIDEANQLFENESQLMQWLEDKAVEMRSSKENYQTNIQLIANKKVYPGVVLKLNNRTWRANREYDRSKISFIGHQWHFEPLI